MELFPHAKQLASAERRPAESGRDASYERATEAMGQMMDEHDHAGALMRRIRTLSNDYVPPKHACNTYRALFETLSDFESDLHRHIHLENNVLFPKVAEFLNDRPAARA